MELLPVPRYGSSLAPLAAKVPAGVRQRLGATDAELTVWDLIVTLCSAAIDDSDPRAWYDRLGAAFDSRCDDFTDEVIQAAADELNRMVRDEPNWAGRLRRDNFIRFLERSVGTGAYEHLRRALLDDLAVVTEALRRAARVLLPYTLALDDMARLLPFDKVTLPVPGDEVTLPLPGDPTRSLLVMAVVIDRHLVALSDAVVGDRVSAEVFSDVCAPTAQDIADAIPRLREAVTGRSRERADRLGAVVGRKIRGARDALTTSSDPVSQAANSLIELIDRTLRTAFPDDEVLAWIDANYPDARAELTYIDKDTGRLRPTKKGQARCFLNLGMPKSEAPTITELLADVLVAARKQLQVLKHADRGTPEEFDQMADLLAGVEGFFALGIGVLWAIAPADAVERVEVRLNPDTGPMSGSRPLSA